MRDYAALLRFLAGREDMPFAWGSAANDCASFAALAIEAQTGENPLGDLEWSNEDEAYAVIERVGGLANWLTAKFTEIPPAMAKRGDVAGVMTGNELGLMIVETDMLVGPGVRKMKRLPRNQMRFAWSAD